MQQLSKILAPLKEKNLTFFLIKIKTKFDVRYFLCAKTSAASPLFFRRFVILIQFYKTCFMHNLSIYSNQPLRGGGKVSRGDADIYWLRAAQLFTQFCPVICLCPHLIKKGLFPVVGFITNFHQHLVLQTTLFNAYVCSDFHHCHLGYATVFAFIYKLRRMRSAERLTTNIADN